MTVVVGCLLGMALVVFILSPFWLGQGGQLVPSAMLSDRGQIEQLKKIVLARYVQDEAAAAGGDITLGEWRRRQQFLVNRYIDLVRRYDYLGHVEAAAAGPVSDRQLCEKEA